MSTAQSPTQPSPKYTPLLLFHMLLFCLAISCVTLFVQGLISLPGSFPFAMLFLWISLWLFWRLDRRYRFDLRLWQRFARFRTPGTLLLVALEFAALLVFGAAQFAPYGTLDLPRRIMGLQGQLDLDSVNLLAYAPDSQTLLTTDFSGTATLVSASTRTVLWRADIGGGAERVLFSPDGTLVAALFNDKHLVLVRTSNGTVLRSIPQVKGESLVFSNDSTLVAVAGREEPARVWRVADGQLLQTVEHPKGFVLLSFGADNRLTTYAVQPTPESFRKVVFSPDGRVAALNGGNSSVDLVDTATGQPLRTVHRRGERIQAMAFSADGTLLATSAGYPDIGVRVWRVADGQQVALYASKLGATGLVFAPDGRTLVSEEYGQLAFWRLP